MATNPVAPSRFRRSVRALAWVSVLAVILSTLATLPARHFWLSDLFANLRVQQVIAIAFAIVASLVGRQRLLTILAVVCLVIHIVPMAPQVITVQDVAKPVDNPIRLMMVNVLTTNRSPEKVLTEIQTVDPDVVAILELGSPLQKRLDDQLASTYPYSVTRAEDRGNFGIGLYSKNPLSHIDVFQLNEEIKSIEVRCNGYRLIATHPLPPMGSRRYRSRNDHLRLLAARIRRSRTESPDTPIVVMGDLNLTPWSPLFRDFERDAGLIRARCGGAIRPTWYARGSSFPFGLVLDHVLVGQSLRCLEYRVGPEIGSDHRSVSVTVGIQRLSSPAIQPPAI